MSPRPCVMHAYIKWKRYPVLGWNPWHVMVFLRSFSSLLPQSIWDFVLQGTHGCLMRACAMRVAAVVF